MKGMWKLKTGCDDRVVDFILYTKANLRYCDAPPQANECCPMRGLRGAWEKVISRLEENFE